MQFGLTVSEVNDMIEQAVTKALSELTISAEPSSGYYGERYIEIRLKRNGETISSDTMQMPSDDSRSY